MRHITVFLLTLLLGSSLAIQNSNGKAPTTSNSNDRDKHDASGASSVGGISNTNTGYRYSGPSHHYLPPAPLATPSPAPSHQHQDEGYKYQAPAVNHASFSLAGSALYQHSSQTPALAINLENSNANNLSEHAPSYYVPSGGNTAEKPENSVGYYTPSYFVTRPPTNSLQSLTVEQTNKGYEYAKPASNNYVGYQYKGQEREPATQAPSVLDVNNGYHYQKDESLTNQAYDKMPNYPKPTATYVPASPSNDYGYHYKYPAAETTQTDSNGYRYQNPAFAPTQTKDESFLNHKPESSKPLFEAANEGHFTGFGYKQEQPQFAEYLGVSSIGQNKNYASSSHLNTPSSLTAESNSNTFNSQSKYSPYPQQPQSNGYTYPAPTQISTHNQIPTHTSNSFSQNFPAQSAATFDLPHPGPVATFAPQAVAVPSPTYLPANIQHGTPNTDHYASGHEDLGYYTHTLNKPADKSPLDYERPSTHLLSDERYPQQAAAANGLDYLQMQSHSYQLPSYFTMQMPADHQYQRFEQPQSQPHEVSYQTSKALDSYASAVQQPHAIYGTPLVEATQATPSHAYLPPSGEFQPPYYIK